MSEERFENGLSRGEDVARDAVDVVVPERHRGLAGDIVGATKEAVELGKDVYDLVKKDGTRAERFDVAQRSFEVVADQAEAFGAPAPVALAARAVAQGIELVEAVVEARDRKKKAAQDDPSETEFRSARAGAPLAPVEVEFRLVEAPEISFEVTMLRWEEGLGQLYGIELELVVADEDGTPEDWLEASCELRVSREVEERVVFGVIATIDECPGLRRFAVRVVPALQLLDLEGEHAVFQGFTVPEIVTKTLEAPLRRYGRALRWDIRRTYAPRDYCVRYEETTLAFALRVLAEEGFTFTFLPDVDAKAETLVIFDHADADPQYRDGEEVPWSTHEGSEALAEGIATLVWRQSITSNGVTCSAYNWKGPRSSEHGAEITDSPRQRTRHVAFDLPQRFSVDDPVGDPQATTYTGLDRTPERAWAERVLDDRLRLRHVAHGTSNLAGLMPRQRLHVAAHPQATTDGCELLVIRVCHTFERGTQGRGASYHNEFSGVHAGVVFRPPLLAKPRVYGAQLATVEGPPGEEVFTDEFGRIKVRFHWDRTDAAGADVSCWVRVSQAMSGAGFGTWFLPRVGMEVLVQFLQGDPDDPVVVGCLYNGKTPLPYPLPEERTKSGFVSQSSPGGSGHHELCFDDTAEREKLSVRAQRRLHVDVKGDESRVVDSNQTIQVDNHREIHVGHDDALTVTGNQTITVRGQKGPRAHQGPAGARTLVQHGDFDVSVDDGHLHLRATSTISITCGDSSILLSPSGISIRAGKISIMAAHSQGSTATNKAELLLEHQKATLTADVVRAESVNSTLEMNDEHIELISGLASKTKVTLQDQQFLAESNDARFRGSDFVVEASQSAFIQGIVKATVTSRGKTEVRGGQTNLHGRPIHLNPPGAPKSGGK